jgi:hypothetical protein
MQILFSLINHHAFFSLRYNNNDNQFIINMNYLISHSKVNRIKNMYINCRLKLPYYIIFLSISMLYLFILSCFYSNGNSIAFISIIVCCCSFFIEINVIGFSREKSSIYLSRLFFSFYYNLLKKENGTHLQANMEINTHDEMIIMHQG